MADRKGGALSNPRQVFVLSGPSGVGKNTIADALRRQGSAVRAVTATTRPARPGEVDGKDYAFLSEDEFRRWMAEGRLVEHTRYLGRYYGTPADAVNRAAASGLPVVLTIDVDGALQMKRQWPEVTLVFIEAPSEEELRRRQLSRGGDDPAAVERRLKRARRERAYAGRYDYRVVNDDLGRAVAEVARILAGAGKPSERAS